MTTSLLQMINSDANVEDIYAYLNDKYIPADADTLMQMAEQILKNPPKIGYLTNSFVLVNQSPYKQIIELKDSISGIIKITDKYVA
jgi:hypothetical protein